MSGLLAFGMALAGCCQHSPHLMLTDDLLRLVVGILVQERAFMQKWTFRCHILYLHHVLCRTLVLGERGAAGALEE